MVVVQKINDFILNICLVSVLICSAVALGFVAYDFYDAYKENKVEKITAYSKTEKRMEMYLKNKGSRKATFKTF